MTQTPEQKAVLAKVQTFIDKFDQYMATHPNPMLRSSLSSLAATEIAKGQGSLTAVPTGTVKHLGVEWDVTLPWHGRELTTYAVRRSLWSKDTVVSMQWLDREHRTHAEFTLHLDAKLPMADVYRAADTYLMILNLARTE